MCQNIRCLNAAAGVKTLFYLTYCYFPPIYPKRCRNNARFNPSGLLIPTHAPNLRGGGLHVTVNVHVQPLNAPHTSLHGGRFQLWSETLGARGDRQRFSNSGPEPPEAAGPTRSMTNHASHPNGMQGLRKEHLYKVLVIGDLGVGKTSIIRRYVHQTYSNNYRATIGVDFALKVLNWDSETVRLQLWDIAGTTDAGSN